MGYSYKYNVYKIASWKYEDFKDNYLIIDTRDHPEKTYWYSYYPFNTKTGEWNVSGGRKTLTPNAKMCNYEPKTDTSLARLYIAKGTYSILVDPTKTYHYDVTSKRAIPIKGSKIKTVTLDRKPFGESLGELYDDRADMYYSDYYYEFVSKTWIEPTPTNSAPVISGEDIDLGEKNRPFDFEYSVKDPDGDNATIVEYLNNSVLRSITNAGDVVQTVRVTDNVFKDKVVNGRNTIKIKATDTAGNTSYRTVYFTRTNNPPTFEEPDKNLGLIKENPTFTFTPNDLDGDKVKCRIKLNQKVIKEYPELTLGEKVSFKMDFKNWMQLNHTVVHNLWIEIEDSAGAIAILKYTFQRDVDRIFYENHQKIDEKPRNIVFTADVDLDIGATMKMYVTNDYSNELAWEEVENGQIHTFQNVNAGENDIGFRIEITKGKGTSVLKRLGGSYN